MPATKSTPTTSAPRYTVRRLLTENERVPLVQFSPLIAQLLFHRGIIDTANAERFVTPDYDRDTNDPFLLKDAEKAATRIIASIKDDEKIAMPTTMPTAYPELPCFTIFLRASVSKISSYIFLIATTKVSV